MNPAYALAVLASGIYGTADFLGGYASRRISALTVTFAAGAVGLLSLGVALIFVRGTPVPQDYLWGAAAGVSGGLGVALLYRAYAIGPVSVAAPVISVVALAMPVIAGVALGERPSPLALGGIVLAVASFPLLAHSHEAGAPRAAHGPVLLISVTSGLLVGGFLVLIARVSPGSGLASLFVARLATVTLFAIILAVRREPFVPAPGAMQSTLLAGLLDSFANVAYVVAVHRAALAIVGTIVSLSPATTVLLARAMLCERWTPHQRAGLAFATAAIVCVSVG